MTSASRTLLEAAIAEADAAACPLWLVGGAVRDLILDRPVHDLDLALDRDASAFAGRVAARLPAAVRAGAEVTAEPAFGTASLRLDGARLDLARLRSERYPRPGALPVVTFGATIEEDLARRDFSVNALALGIAGPPAGRLVDPFGGAADLGARRLRVLHTRSFRDDATRLWRAARTAAVFDLHPDAETARLIAEGARHLDGISGDRLLAEIAFTAARGRAGRTLVLAEAWGILRGVHPAFRLGPATARALRRRAAAVPLEVLLAVLLAPLPGRAGVLSRLHAPRSLARVVEQAAALLEAGRGVDQSPEALERLAGATVGARTAARWLEPESQRGLQRDLARWERTRPAIAAAEVMRLGIAPGPRLGAVLHGLRRARYLGTLRTPAEARAEARRIAAGPDGGARRSRQTGVAP